MTRGEPGTRRLSSLFVLALTPLGCLLSSKQKNTVQTFCLIILKAALTSGEKNILFRPQLLKNASQLAQNNYRHKLVVMIHVFMVFWHICIFHIHNLYILFTRGQMSLGQMFQPKVFVDVSGCL